MLNSVLEFLLIVSVIVLIDVSDGGHVKRQAKATSYFKACNIWLMNLSCLKQPQQFRG